MDEMEYKLCKHGHVKSPENTFKDGKCKICSQAYDKKRLSNPEVRAKRKDYSTAPDAKERKQIYNLIYREKQKEQKLMDFEKEFTKKMVDIKPLTGMLFAETKEPLHKRILEGATEKGATLLSTAKRANTTNGIAMTVINKMHTKCREYVNKLGENDVIIFSGTTDESKIFDKMKTINLDNSKYVLTDDVIKYIRSKDEDCDVKIKMAEQKIAAKLNEHTELLKIKRIGSFRTMSDDYMEITFNYKDTNLRPGQEISVSVIK